MTGQVVLNPRIESDHLITWEDIMVTFLKISKTAMQVIVFCGVCFGFSSLQAQSPVPKFKVVAFYTGRSDQAHISLLLAIDAASFPLGTGPKPYEIWHDGYYPVVWSNKNYKMIYVNMGHNDMDYEHKFDNTNKTLSFTYDNEIQNRLIIDGLIWLGGGKEL